MDWRDIAGTVAKVAPVLGSVLGGPAGAIAGAAGTLISSCLGVEPSPEAVSSAIQDPETLLKLREIEAQERGRLLDWQAAQLKAENENTKDARATMSDAIRAGSAVGMFPALLSLLITGGFFGSLCLVVTFTVPAGMREPVLVLLGALSREFGTVCNFWLGSSLGSARKDAAPAFRQGGR